MNSEQARSFCHAYLDGQLGAETKSEIDRVIAADIGVADYYDEQRAFLAVVKKRTQTVAAPANLEAGIRARLSATRQKSSNVIPFPKQAPARSRRRWMMYAAGLLLTLGAGAVLFWMMHEECPYMVACITEHSLVLNGKGDFAAKTSDAEKLAQWVSGEVQTTLKELPTGKQFNLALEGAGHVEFKSLRQWGSPGGVFVSYEGPNNSHVTLLVHRWPEEEPEIFNRMNYNGHVYWATKHKGFGVAAWKSPDDKLVITVVSDQSRDATLEIADAMRKQIDAQIASHRVAFLTPGLSAQK